MSDDTLQQGSMDERQPIPTTTQSGESQVSDDNLDEDERDEGTTDPLQVSQASRPKTKEAWVDDTQKELRALPPASPLAFLRTQSPYEATKPLLLSMNQAKTAGKGVKMRGYVSFLPQKGRKERLASSDDGRGSSKCQEKDLG